jgi:hypothetical protein
VNFALDGVEGDGVVRCVWCEDCDGGAGGEGVDCGFVGIWIDLVVCGVGFEGCVEVVVDFCDVFGEVFTWIAASVMILELYKWG